MAQTNRIKPHPELAMFDVPAPSRQLGQVVSLQSPSSRLSPKQHIYFYPPDEWEEFVREWVSSLEENYVRVKRVGGPNDRGLDVVGLLTDYGLEGPWDCYQCKHYAKPLQKNDAFKEIAKILLGVIEGVFVLPRRYRFLAPQGCSTSLERLFSQPTGLKQEFLKYAVSPTSIREIGNAHSAVITALADVTDFSIFNSEGIDDVLEQHATTAYHAWRFAQPLDHRPSPAQPPKEIEPTEVRYVAQLIEAYCEKSGGAIATHHNIESGTWYAKHLNRQRFAFYSAEALRLFARDKVPTGTFEALQEDVHSGVVETEQASHTYAIDRLTAVLDAAVRLELSANILIQALRVDDRKGICHQLANEDRLRWSQ